MATKRLTTDHSFTHEIDPAYIEERDTWAQSLISRLTYPEICPSSFPLKPISAHFRDVCLQTLAARGLEVKYDPKYDVYNVQGRMEPTDMPKYPHALLRDFDVERYFTTLVQWRTVRIHEIQVAVDSALAKLAATTLQVYELESQTYDLRLLNYTDKELLNDLNIIYASKPRKYNVWNRYIVGNCGYHMYRAHLFMEGDVPKATLRWVRRVEE